MAKSSGGLLGELIKLILAAFFQAEVSSYKSSRKPSKGRK